MKINPGLFSETIIPKYFLRRFAAICLLMFTISITNGQVGIGTTKPESSAALHVDDTTRGLLIPRVTTLQRNNIQNPAEGLMIYQTDGAKGFWYFTSGQWKNMVPANSGGKQTIVLSGNISDGEAAVKIAAEYGVNTQVIRIVKCNNLTTVDLSMVTDATEISILSNPLLQTVNLSGLVSVESFFGIRFCPALTTLQLTALQEMSQGTADEGFTISHSGITDLQFPALTLISGNFVIEQNDNLKAASFPALLNQQGEQSNIKIQMNSSLTSVLFPQLRNAETLLLSRNAKLATLSVPLLATVDFISFSNSLLTTSTFPSLATAKRAVHIFNNTVLTTASFPALVSSGALTIQSNPVLTHFSMPALTGNAGSIQITNNFALTELSLNITTADVVEITGNTVLSAVLFPALTKANTNFHLTSNPVLTNISVPALISAGKLTIDNDAVTSFSVPALTTVGSLTIASKSLAGFSSPALQIAGSLHFNQNHSNTALTSLSFPALTSLTDGSKSTSIYMDGLVSIDLDNLATFQNSGFTLNGNLPSSQVNYLLNKFVTISPPIVGKHFDLKQFGDAPPTGQGLIDKATLKARPNSVITD